MDVRSSGVQTGTGDLDVAASVLEDVLPSTVVTARHGAGQLSATREGLALTAIEQELVDLAPAAVEVLGDVVLDGAGMSRHRLVEDVLVTRMLAARTPSAAEHRVPSTVLSAVRSLSSRQEEGRAAVSGVLVVDDVGEWRDHVADDASLVLEPFAVPLAMDERFFSHPATHHYVDGCHSLFVVGPDLSVVGLLRILDRHDPLAVAAGAHLDPVLDGPPAWCASVDANSTVNVRAAGGLHLRRRTSHWRLLDPAIVPGCLTAAGMDDEDAWILASALAALSDDRTGTFVLVPTAGQAPAVAGMVDSSHCGAVLLTHLLGRSLRDLRDHDALLGILSCDGLTMFSRAGELLLTGAIVDLHALDGTRSGGSRTHATASASVAGMALMVSADGQITVFHHGTELVHLER